VTDAIDVAELERLKYEKVYAFPGYGAKGHGAPIAGLLIERTRPGLLGDFGCGRGGSFRPYIEAGHRIQPIDHIDVLAAEWRTNPAVLPPVVANLWRDPLPAVDAGLCTDVMEHIPEAFVEKTLANIAAAVRGGCLWTVCHVPDVWGSRINDRLHMTVQPEPWWTERMRKYWDRVEILRSVHGNTIYWTRHNGNVVVAR